MSYDAVINNEGVNMIPKDTSGPAFHIPGLRQNETFTGMTLRDYFAAKTLSAIISGSMADGSAFDADAFSVMSKVAYMMADSMLKARAE